MTAAGTATAASNRLAPLASLVKRVNRDSKIRRTEHPHALHKMTHPGVLVLHMSQMSARHKSAAAAAKPGSSHT